MKDVEDILFRPRRLPAGTLRRLLKASILPLLLGGIWLVVGAGLGAVFACIGNPVHDYRLSRNAETAEGTVAEVRVKRSARINGKNPWVILYVFQGNGREWRGESFTTKKELISGLGTGSKIEVEYLSARPGINRAKGTRASLFPAFAFLAPVSFVVAGGAVFLCGAAKVLRLLKLLVNGQVALATVTGQKLNRYINMGRRSPLEISYEFQDSRGMERSGRTRVYFPRPGLEAVEGTRLKIVYDSANPRRNFGYELYGIDLSGEG